MCRIAALHTLRETADLYAGPAGPGLLLEGLGFAADLMQDESLLELFEIRMLLEPAATAKAAEKISDGRLDELTAILEQMHRCTDDDSVLVQHDARFHELVAQSAGNQTLASLLGNMSSRTMQARLWHGVREAGSAEATVSQHAEILNALQARDPKVAYAAAVLHVGKTHAWFRQIVEAGDWRRPRNRTSTGHSPHRAEAAAQPLPLVGEPC